MLELQAGSDESLDPEVVGVSRLGLGRSRGGPGWSLRTWLVRNILKVRHR